ncbi:helix-turn-helix transcriptional regulator [Naasia aerilata]|uniref:DNA-binding transcriptional regulator n=1 Tax=Naasia aerilata TaxID=1162966 RepID=A0ABM8GEN1_9MICO|nr:YafY family protein [Naasia aerilata]BDZ46772.1 DNA-binding transcriptional regulator [Naasia aerilata]
MSGTTTTSRVLALLDLLQTHRHWTGAELTRRLGVTTRTLRRDVDRLRGLGYRVDSVPGVAGGYRLMAGSALPPLLLTDDEAVAMAVGLRAAAVQALADGGVTALTALAKLEHLLPPALRGRVNALGGSVQPGGTGPAPVSPDLLGQLALACRDTERIRFRYVAADGVESRRVVEPHSLVAGDRAWFLVAWDRDRGDWRTFRVDRISDLTQTRVPFSPRPLPAADAAQFVAAGSSRQSRRAQVLLGMPLAAMREHFGAWAGAAEDAGDGRTRWPIGGRSNEELLAALVWIPADVDYEVHGDEEFSRFLAAAGERLTSAASR